MRDGLTQQLEQEAANLGKLLATTLAKPLYFFDLDDIAGVLEPMATLESVAFVHLEDKDGQIVHDGSSEIADFGKPHNRAQIRHQGEVGAHSTWEADGVYNVVEPVLIGSRLIGTLHLGISTAHMQAELAALEQDLVRVGEEGARQTISISVIVSVLLALLGIGTGIYVARSLSEPILELSQLTRRIGGRRLSGRDRPEAGR